MQMKQLQVQAGFLLVMLCFLSIAACKHEKVIREDLYPNFSLPVYEGGFDIIINNEAEVLGKDIIYNIDVPYPPDELLKFYYDYFEKHKLKIIENDLGTEGKWQTENSEPRRYVARWTDKDENITVLLTLTYKQPKNEQSSLEVFCFIHPFVSSDRVDKFIEKKTKNPEWSKEFQSVIEKYGKKNETIDLEKVLQDYPDSELIKELMTIEKDMKAEAQKKYNAFVTSTSESATSQLKGRVKQRLSMFRWDLKEMTKVVIDFALVVALTVLPLILRRRRVHTICVALVLFIQLNLLYFGLRLVAENVPLPLPEISQQQVKYSEAWLEGRMAMHRNVNAYLLPLTLYTLSLGILGITRPEKEKQELSKNEIIGKL